LQWICPWKQIASIGIQILRQKTLQPKNRTSHSNRKKNFVKLLTRKQVRFFMLQSAAAVP
jgi:hypothetical protein